MKETGSYNILVGLGLGLWGLRMAKWFRIALRLGLSVYSVGPYGIHPVP